MRGQIVSGTNNSKRLRNQIIDMNYTESSKERVSHVASPARKLKTDWRETSHDDALRLGLKSQKNTTLKKMQTK